MKKFKALFILSIVLMSLLSSCASSVSVSTLVPAQVSLAGAKKVAIIETKTAPDDYSWGFYNKKIPVQTDSTITIPEEILTFGSLKQNMRNATIGKYLSATLVKALNQGVYEIIDPASVSKLTGAVDARKNLLKNGVDVVISSEITATGYDELIKAVKAEDGKVSFYLCQKVTVSATITAQDVRDLKILDTCSFSSQSKESTTLLGYTDKDGKFTKATENKMIPQPNDMAKTVIESYEDSLMRRLTPHYETNYIDLIKDKTKDENLKEAAKLADKGSYEPALAVYMNHYNIYKDDVSGYNAAAILYALGQYDEAIRLCNEVGSAKALELAWVISSNVKLQNEALNQLAGTVKNQVGNELIGF